MLQVDTFPGMQCRPVKAELNINFISRNVHTFVSD